MKTAKKKTILFFSLGLAVLLLLSACRPQPSQPANNNWQNEIGVAHQCGEEGLACCLDRQPSCFYNLSCCQNPNNPKQTECREECHCGQAGDFCCAGNVCQPGLACWQGHCQKCGGQDEPCCPGQGQPCAQDNLACANGLCVACGLVGNPCCSASSSLSCLSQNARDKTRAECRGGFCRPCGFAGQAACQSQPACLPKHLLNNGVCYACGEFNQPCCDKASQGYDCNPEKGLVCRLGFCLSAADSEKHEEK